MRQDMCLHICFIDELMRRDCTVMLSAVNTVLKGLAHQIRYPDLGLITKCTTVLRAVRETNYVESFHLMRLT